MTRQTNARLAGFTFLLYIASGVASLALFGGATRGEGIAVKLAGIAEHAPQVRLCVLLDLLQCFCAVVLGVTLHALTRRQDRDLALLALACRVGEGVLGATGIPSTLGLLWLATAAGAQAPDVAAAHALAAFLFKGYVALTATFFAVGSTLFSWLLWRGRMIPAPLAGLGLAASVLLVLTLPLELAGFFPSTMLVWLPMLGFEVLFALWLIVRGVAVPLKGGGLGARVQAA